MTKPWEDSPEVHAEIQRRAMEEIEQRDWLADATRADWKRRLLQAIRDGLDLEGQEAVLDAIAPSCLTGTAGTIEGAGSDSPHSLSSGSPTVLQPRAWLALRWHRCSLPRPRSASRGLRSPPRATRSPAPRP